MDDFFTDRVLENVQMREEKISAGDWPSGNNAAPRSFTTRDIKADKFRMFSKDRLGPAVWW
jgi:hypothetical protein